VNIVLAAALSIAAGPSGSAPVAAPAAPSILAPQNPKAPEKSDLEKKYEEKLKEPFLKKAPWLLDYDKALAEAKKTGKLVFGYFSRSYAY
jgi:hypothetical protein